MIEFLLTFHLEAFNGFSINIETRDCKKGGVMSSYVSRQVFDRSRRFIGGSECRIIMGHDEAGLIRLWQEKRGEVGPEDFSGNLIVQLGTATEDLNRTWYERNTGRSVAHVQSFVKHSAIPWMAATLDGIVDWNRRRIRSQVHAAVVLLRGGGGRKAHGSGAAQHVGHAPEDRRALDHHRGREVG